MKLTAPTLLVDKSKVMANIEMMAAKAKQNNIRFRPHFKTHQSAQIGEWFREFGVSCITVSSIDMAVYFAANGWNDITVAFPVNVREYEKINELAASNTLNLVTTSAEAMEKLGAQLTASVNMFIKTDTGYNRTGVWHENTNEFKTIIESIEQQPNIQFKGFLAHAGHTYKAASREEINMLHNETRERLVQLKRHFSSDIPNIELSLGDTPSCSVANDYTGIDEMRPGNFVFYDLYQYHLGACNFNQVAVAMACPVVAKHPEKDKVIIHGGAVHFSKDQLPGPLYGRIVQLNENGWSSPIEGMEVISLSQEHGTVQVTPAQMDEISIGDVLTIIPIHSCLTGNLMRGYQTLDGKQLDHIYGS
jgi:D-serine deaminase-like pyridoxal phosphate-dependent protein